MENVKGRSMLVKTGSNGKKTYKLNSSIMKGVDFAISVDQETKFSTIENADGKKTCQWIPVDGKYVINVDLDIDNDVVNCNQIFVYVFGNEYILTKNSVSVDSDSDVYLEFR